MGKTYHLYYIREILNRNDLRIVHITDPGIHPYHLIRRILLELGEEEVATMMWGIIGPYLKEKHASDPQFFDDMARMPNKVSPSRANQYSLQLGIAELDDEAWSDHRLFFRAIDKNLTMDRQRLLAAVTMIVTTPNKPTFITEITHIAQDLAAICLFDGIPALERWKALTEGVGLGSIPSGNEPQFLTALLTLLKKSGVAYFVLLLDEFEKVPQLERLTDKEARQYLDTIRMLIDEGHGHLPFAYVIGSNEDAWRLAIERIEPLRHRFKVVHLPPMIEDAAATYIITAYLQLARLNQSEAVSLAPFPSNMLELIPVNARVTTRQLVKLCYELIEEAIKRELDSIPEEVVTAKFLSAPTANTEAEKQA